MTNEPPEVLNWIELVAPYRYVGSPGFLLDGRWVLEIDSGPPRALAILPGVLLAVAGQIIDLQGWLEPDVRKALEAEGFQRQSRPGLLGDVWVATNAEIIAIADEARESAGS